MMDDDFKSDERDMVVVLRCRMMFIGRPLVGPYELAGARKRGVSR